MAKALIPLRYVASILALALVAGCARFEPKPIAPAESAARLQSRTLSDPKLHEFLNNVRPGEFENWPLPSWDFETLYLAALYYHPSLDLARAQWQVAVGGRKTAAALPNPVLTAVPGYNLSPTAPLSPWIPSVSLDVPIETAGKRGYRRAEAGHLAESARLNITAVAWQVRSNLRTSLIEFVAAQQREGLLAHQKVTQEKVIDSLEQQLKAGAISSSELTLIRIALGQIQLDLSDAQQQRAEARVRVADGIGVTVAALEGIDLAYDLSASPSLPDLLSMDIRQQALEYRVDIQAALADYAAQQSALQLEIAKQYPDIHLGPGYQYDQGDHKVTLSLAMDLPILNQNQGPIAVAEARRGEAAARFLVLQAKVLTEIDRATTTCQAAVASVVTLESLAASHRRRADVVEAQVRAGAADQLDVLNAQIELGSSQLLQLTGRVKLQQSLAALEDAVQRPLTPLLSQVIEQPPRSQTIQEPKP